MRIGVTLPSEREVEVGAAAEAVGVPFVQVVGEPGVESAIAATVAATTTRVRIIVSIQLGDENPVTLAEEIAVLDNVSNGRIGVIAELGPLDAERATEDVTVLRAAWSGRPIAHRGKRWQVPAGMPDHVAPPAVMVTPAPAQLDIPLWLAGEASGVVGRTLSLPAVVARPADIDASTPIAPGRCTLAGDLNSDRRAVIDWSNAGATHLLCALSGSTTLEVLTRWLIPEVAMVGFPRVVADSPMPARWPRQHPQE